LTTKGGSKMRKGKNYIESAKLIDRTKLYDSAEAFDIVIKANTLWGKQLNQTEGREQMTLIFQMILKEWNLMMIGKVVKVIAILMSHLILQVGFKIK
jgi:hypothetical protein